MHPILTSPNKKQKMGKVPKNVWFVFNNYLKKIRIKQNILKKPWEQTLLLVNAEIIRTINVSGGESTGPKCKNNRNSGSMHIELKSSVAEW